MLHLAIPSLISTEGTNVHGFSPCPAAEEWFRGNFARFGTILPSPRDIVAMAGIAVEVLGRAETLVAYSPRYPAHLIPTPGRRLW